MVLLALSEPSMVMKKKNVNWNKIPCTNVLLILVQHIHLVIHTLDRQSYASIIGLL